MDSKFKTGTHLKTTRDSKKKNGRASDFRADEREAMEILLESRSCPTSAALRR